METPLYAKRIRKCNRALFSSKRNGIEMEVKPPFGLHFVAFDNPPLFDILLLPITTCIMSSTLLPNMEDDLIDNAFLTMRGGAAATARPTMQPNQSCFSDEQKYFF